MLSPICVAQDASTLDSIPSFRGYNWGTNIEKVRSTELADYMQTYIGFGSYVISYKTRLIGFEARMDYVFEDSILTEASYELEGINFETVFQDIKKYYYNILGLPNYWASSHPDLSINWNEEENGICRGPEIYWEYCDGFIGIVAEQYKESISITILYVKGKSINNYGKYVKYPYPNN